MNFRPLVVIPTYNNAETIASIAQRSIAAHPDVLVVDDGSTDGSGQRAREVEGAVVVHHAKNQGKGAAIATGLRWAAQAGFSHIVTIDADLQHPPEDIPRFIEAARADPWAIHVGSRANMDTAPGVSQFGRNFSNFWIWVETGHRVDDSQSGYRVYPVTPVRSLGLSSSRYEWEVSVLVRAIWAGIAVRNISYQVYYPTAEERVSSFRPLWDNVRISLLNTVLVTSRILWPPRWINRVPEPGGVWQGQNLGRVWGWMFFLKLLRLLGRWPTYAAMIPMSLFYVVFAGAHRKGVGAYLQRIQSSGLATWRIFFNFACSLVDRFLVMGRGPEAFTFVREGEEALNTLVERGGLILTAHIGNPDLFAAALRRKDGTGRPINIVQYSSAQDPYIHLMQRQLKEHAPKIISLNSDADMASLSIIRALRANEIVALKGDRHSDKRVTTVQFLGESIEMAVGPFLLAALSGAPLVMMGCFKEGSGTYHIIAAPPRYLRWKSRNTRDEQLNEWAQDFAKQLEVWVRRYPFQWYNFHDIWHR